MYWYFLFCIIPFIPPLSGTNTATLRDTNKLPPNITVKTKSDLKDLNATKVLLITEGGSIEPNIPTLPEEKHSSLINVDKEISNTKVKSVVPRKGVVYNPAEDIIPVVNSTIVGINTSVAGPRLLTHNVNLTAGQQQSTEFNLINSTFKNDKDNLTETSSTTHPELPKKPTVLSAEAILETDKIVQMEREKMGLPSKPKVLDQLPSPRSKFERNNSNSHPGMVMPIVITMLVVPMFAALGYMALRRGQEAWKNRHYKRMDFLLDGMYND